jgi:CBS domain containing-hemolysin-like protein
MTLLVLYAALALGVSFICSLLEASLLSLPRSHIESLVEQGSHAGRAMQRLKENIDRPLAAILTLNTVAHTVGAAGVGAQAAALFGSGAVGVASAIMTLAILILSEIIPKTMGAVHAKSLVGITAWLTRGMIVVCYPIIVVLEWVHRLITYQRHGLRTSRMELLATIRLAREGGSLDDREHRIMTNLLALSRVRLSEILTPRTVMFTLPAEMTVGEALREHPSIRFARIPIHVESADDIKGYVTRYEIHKAAAEERAELPLRHMQRSILALPEQASVADASEQMLDKGEHMAIVVDEYGGVEGIITLEDVLETLLGQEIIDETDPVADMQVLARRRARREAP